MFIRYKTSRRNTLLRLEIPATLGYSNFTSGATIIGLLSTPEYTDNHGLALPNLSGGGYSNHIVAYVHSLSGPAVEKPPQNNPLLAQDSFTYRIICANVPVQLSVNNTTAYATNLEANLHELRLAFLWPQLPNGSLGKAPPASAGRVLGWLSRHRYDKPAYVGGYIGRQEIRLEAVAFPRHHETAVVEGGGPGIDVAAVVGLTLTHLLRGGEQGRIAGTAQFGVLDKAGEAEIDQDAATLARFAVRANEDIHKFNAMNDAAFVGLGKTLGDPGEQPANLAQVKHTILVQVTLK